MILNVNIIERLYRANGGVLDSYGISGKAETPEAKESRPMESEHPVVEFNITKLPLRKFGKGCFSTA